MTGVVSAYLGKIQKYLNQSDVEEIVACRPGEIMLYKRGATSPRLVDDKALTEAYWRDLASALANRERRPFGDLYPHLSVMLDGGHRAAFSIGPAVQERVAVAIRLFRPVSIEYSDFGMDATLASRVQDAVRCGSNILISGGTSSGKTTLLRRMTKDIPIHERLITVEDVRELIDMPHKNLTQYSVFEGYDDEGGGDYASVMDIAMRMRPDRIITGELRIDNSWSVVRLLNTGHRGFMATLHADDPRAAMHAIKTMIGMANRPNDSVIEFLESQIDIILQVGRSHETGERRVLEVLDLAEKREEKRNAA
ncbi:putative bacterial type II secretion system protein E [Tepidicaulis marinus]|uniref:Putative bacterial type II secretion system protein E n=1 Tax=Tepidicaulis marinus TaxID=1333998 RepID=A0A081BF38_9HYPH|nr:ATPase, T2SS/T4P/T4SS family [Tepidicaulis marinus]GAK46656.1 putative bacterial type II secretion system protein E [Tepidicaulis marinus]